MTIKTMFKNINWEASSVILAMMIFAGNIFYTSYQNEAKLESEKENIRKMFAFEIAYNHHTLKFLDETRHIGFDKDAEHMTGEPFAINLKVLGGARLHIASDQNDDVYRNYFGKLSILDKEEITLIMNYYHEQRLLMEGIKSTQDDIRHARKGDPDIEAYSLESHFMKELRLSEELLQRYSHLRVQEPETPEIRDK